VHSRRESNEWLSLSTHPSIHPCNNFLLGICIGSWEVQCITSSHMEGDVQKSASFGGLGLPEISSYNNHEHDMDIHTASGPIHGSFNLGMQ